MLRRILLLTALCATSSFAFAGSTNHVVTVSNFQFSPSTLTIAAGDTVTFTKAASAGTHNVASTSGPTSFRCAQGCDATGGNGNPSGAAWSATVTFPTEGDVEYLCEVHGASMSGSITVGPVPVELQSFDIE